MSSGKYIAGRLKCGDVTAVCFNHIVNHSTFKNMFSEIYGAGFFDITLTNNVVAYGASVSLEIISRGDRDSLLIKQALGLAEEY